MTNAAIQRYYGILTAARAEEYLTYEETISATGGSASFNTTGLTAASNFLDVRKLHWLRGTDDVVEIVRGTPEDWHLRSESSREWSSGVKYALIRSSIYWLPVPSSTYSVRVWYTGTPGDISGSTAIDGGPNWEDFVVVDVCARIADREEKDASAWKMERAKLEDSIVKQLRRNRGQPRQTADGRGAERQRSRRNFPWWPQ